MAGIWWLPLPGFRPAVDSFRPAVGVNVPEYKCRCDLALAAQDSFSLSYFMPGES